MFYFPLLLLTSYIIIYSIRQIYMCVCVCVPVSILSLANCVCCISSAASVHYRGRAAVVFILSAMMAVFFESTTIQNDHDGSLAFSFTGFRVYGTYQIHFVFVDVILLLLDS